MNALRGGPFHPTDNKHIHRVPGFSVAAVHDRRAAAKNLQPSGGYRPPLQWTETALGRWRLPEPSVSAKAEAEFRAVEARTVKPWTAKARAIKAGTVPVTAIGSIGRIAIGVRRRIVRSRGRWSVVVARLFRRRRRLPGARVNGNRRSHQEGRAKKGDALSHNQEGSHTAGRFQPRFRWAWPSLNKLSALPANARPVRSPPRSAPSIPAARFSSRHGQLRGPASPRDGKGRRPARRAR
jgi:hypothetical protein